MRVPPHNVKRALLAEPPEALLAGNTKPENAVPESLIKLSLANVGDCSGLDGGDGQGVMLAVPTCNACLHPLDLRPSVSADVRQELKEPWGFPSVGRELPLV